MLVSLRFDITLGFGWVVFLTKEENSILRTKQQIKQQRLYGLWQCSCITADLHQGAELSEAHACCCLDIRLLETSP